MGLQPEGMIRGSESYEYLGEVITFVSDLHARYNTLMEQRRLVVAGDALVSFIEDFDAPPPLVWTWLNDPQKRDRYSFDHQGNRFVPTFRPGGRMGAGATTHCAHGKNIAMRETVLDWKPFDYFTVEQDNGPMGIIQITSGFEELEPGLTRLTVHIKGRMGKMPVFLNDLLIRLLYGRIFNYRSIILKMKNYMGREMELSPVPDQPPDSLP